MGGGFWRRGHGDDDDRGCTCMFCKHLGDRTGKLSVCVMCVHTVEGSARVPAEAPRRQGQREWAGGVYGFDWVINALSHPHGSKRN